MGSSLILQGGAAVAKTLKESIAQTGHGFSVGSVIRWDGTAATPKYVLALADTATNAEVAGVVNQVDDTDNFQVTYHGYIDIPSLSGVSAPVMFLSSSAGGSLDASPPSAVGTVVKPVLTKNTNGSGYLVMNYLGTQIGGSSTIAVDEIQPVGTIMPFAGTVIPDTWLECNGASYSVSAYPELYTKLQYGDGDRAPLYGYVMEMQISNSTVHSATAVGDAIIIRKAGGSISSTSGTPGTVGQYDLIGRVRSKTASLTTGSLALVVELVPKYDSGTKSFGFSNTVPNSTSSCNIYSYNQSTPQPAEVDVLNGTWRGSATANITSVAIAAFKTPDMRGRFPVGVNPSAYNQEDADAVLASAINGYTMGQLGGEEQHILTTGEMPSHNHGITDPGHSHQYTYRSATAPQDGNSTQCWVGTSTQNTTVSTTGISINSTGSNTPHNNMPPYLAVRYIIKAKPYTRAAIIDGIDLPYNSLLVRDLRTRNVGGSNSDLVFYTNTSGDSGSGTERMRIYGNGNTGDILFPGDSSNSERNPLILSVGGTRINNNRDDAYFISTKQDGTTVGYFGFNGYSTQSFKYTAWEVATRGVNDSASVSRLYIDQTGNVGIGTGAVSHGATLDVNGTLRVGNFGGSTNVMAKATNAAGGVGQVIPLLTWGGNIGSATVPRNHAAPIPAGTWFVFMTSNTDSTTGDAENTSFTMAQTWVVPAGQWLVFAHSHAYTSFASDSISGLAWKLVTDPAPYRTASNDFPPAEITGAKGWTWISKTNGTAQLINEQNADTATGGDRPASGCVYQGGGGWFVASQISGYAMRIA